MGLCKDKSVELLQGLGYNMVRHPREGIAPSQLIGQQNNTSAVLGDLEGLMAQPAPTAPAVRVGQGAADINGQESSSFDLAIGLNLLGSLIGAMGGTLGLKTEYTNAKKVSFVFESVLSDSVDPLEVDTFLSSGQVNAASPLIGEYALGNGRLYVITEAVKSSKFTVKHELDTGVEAKVDVPVIEELVDGEVSLSFSGQSQGSVTFAGEKPLVFGFRCLALGILEGQLKLTLSKPGTVPLSLSGPVAEEEFALLAEPGEGMLDLQS